MTSHKYICTIFEFRFHNLKEHHEIPLDDVQNKSNVYCIGRDMATCVLALSPSNLFNFPSVHNFLNRAKITVIR